MNHHKCYPAVNKNHSRQNNAKTAVASARVPVALIDAKGELQLNKNVQCPCCKVATKFVPDKSFENIVSIKVVFDLIFRMMFPF